MSDPEHAEDDAPTPEEEDAPPEQTEAVEGAGQAPAGEPAEERATIEPDRNFEEEYRLETTEAGDFLVELGEQLRSDDEVTLVGEEWELPFQFGEPVELEVEFEGMGEPELEVEVQLPYRDEGSAPGVE